MYESPSSLQDVCLDYICDNLDTLCEAQASLDDGSMSVTFSGDDVCFPSNLSDRLLATLCSKGKLTDQTMLVFDHHVTSLKRVRIKDAPLSTKGLRVLRPHKILELEAIGLTKVSVNELIGCLGEKTLSNLKVLNVSNMSFMNGPDFCVVVSLSKLKHLQYLNVSSTDFNKHGLEIITDDLPGLEALDISDTPVNDLTPLRKLRDSLKSLSMYNLRATQGQELVNVICDLPNLQYLDVSDDFSAQPFVNLHQGKFPIRDFLKLETCLPQLSSLDISGKNEVNEALLQDFIESHPKLVFLGLVLTEASEFSIFTDSQSPRYKSDIKVAGDATEPQLVESLTRYTNRALYVQKCLYHLFRITQQLTESRTDLIKLIIPPMRSHPRLLGVQMAATACLYNLSKSEMGSKVHPYWLARVVELTMSAMENFPNHKQLQKNALLTLCSDRILQDVTFDHFRCAKLVMECLCTFDDPSMDRMSVAICGILAAKIPTDQTTQLGGQASYMKKLLNIVTRKCEDSTVDITLKFTLSALWNLTDESPATCKMFLNEGGLALFMRVLETFQDVSNEDRVSVQTKVLGLINNLAEVKDLHSTLLTDDITSMIQNLLSSEHIDVSYFAAGIISHLISNAETGAIPDTAREEMLTELGKAVLNWKQPQGEMVAYRSFAPFFPLLDKFDAPQVQLWALWAMQHVCTKSASRYCPMLVREGGATRLSTLAYDPDSHPEVRRLSGNVLVLIGEKLGPLWNRELLW